MRKSSRINWATLAVAFAAAVVGMAGIAQPAAASAVSNTAVTNTAVTNTAAANTAVTKMAAATGANTADSTGSLAGTPCTPPVILATGARSQIFAPAIAASSGRYAIAFPNWGSRNGCLTTVDQTATTTIQSLGMSNYASAAIAAVPGGYQKVFDSDVDTLWVAGPLGTRSLGRKVLPGSRPSVVAVNGSYQTAFIADNGHLWTAGALGTRDFGAVIQEFDSNPSIASVNGGYLIAFQNKSGALAVADNAGVHNLGLGMWLYTTPAITAVHGGYQVAFKSNHGKLFTWGIQGTYDFGLLIDSDPAIAAVTRGSQNGFQVIYEQAGGLATAGLLGNRSLGLGVYTADSEFRPLTATVTALNGSYQVAFLSNHGAVWTTGVAGTRQLTANQPNFPNLHHCTC